MEPKHIRVLKLYSGPYHEKVRFALSEVALDDHLGISYEALSYTWGNPAITTAASCDDNSFYVTLSLDEALRRMRLETEDRILWIDAICIDQSNITERGQQVELMAEIYRSAKRVLIWLGPEADRSDEAMAYIANLDADLYSREFEQYERYRESGERNTRDWVLAQSLQLVQDTDIHHALESLLCRPWFRRVWIQQEAVPCPDTVVVCGKKTVPWKQLFAFIWAVNRENETGNPDSILWKRGAPEALNLSMNIQLGRNYKTRADGGAKPLRMLTDLLFDFIRCESTDPRDKVFALLGLTHDDDSVTWDPKPNYHRTAGELYQDVATRYLERGVHHLLMYAGRSSQRLPEIPSWTPDWSGHNIGSIFQNLLGSLAGWRASGNLPINVRVSSSEEKEFLFSYGKVIDSITRVTGLPEIQDRNSVNHSASAKDKEALLRHEEICAALSQRSERYGDTKQDAYRRTLVVNLGPGRVPAAKSDTSDKAYGKWLEYLRRGASGDHGLSPPAYSQAIFTSGAFCATQFCTSQSGYMCLAPAGTEQGDLMCILTGIQVPMIVRARGSSAYEIIGPCYVHGIMDGEEAPLASPTPTCIEEPSLEEYSSVEYRTTIAPWKQAPFNTPEPMLGTLDGLYSKLLISRKLISLGVTPAQTAGCLAIALYTIPQPVYQLLYPEADYDFELKSGEYVWVFSGRPNSYTGLTLRGERGEFACWWVAIVNISSSGRPSLSSLPPGWESRPRTGDDSYQEFRHDALDITSWVSPLVLDVRAGPVPPGWIAGRRVLKDMGESRRTYFIDQKTGQTTFDDLCLREDVRARYPQIMGFV
ncbi:hypothetical protein MBLNU459_g6019t2 [Dothideomycetes sp. NU459]